MKQIYSLFFLFLFAVSSAQTEPRSWLEGKLIMESGDLEGISIVNINGEFSVASHVNGYFIMWARPGDSLMVSAIHIKGKTVTLTQEDFEKSIYFIRLEPMATTIDEVRVRQYKNITAESLGIVKNVKRYTPAERRLKAASEMSIGSIITLDPLINLITGRTARLKKELAIERKERLMDFLENNFEKSFFVDQLKIPDSHYRGFLYYAVEDKPLAELAKKQDSGVTQFRLAELAADYIKMMTDGK